jgi:hypothetical protein
LTFQIALILGSVFLGAFTQSLAGFGVALVTMAVLPGLLGIQTASPLVALLSLVLELVILVIYRRALNMRAVLPLALAAAVGIPLGVLLIGVISEDTVLFILGMVIAGFAIYALLGIRLPEMKHPGWAYGMGFLAGVLGGAYNTSGPPVVIYANCRRWEPAQFKTNLQGFFFISNILVVANHGLAGNITFEVWTLFLWALPALAGGILAGTFLSRRLSPEIFRKIVLLLLIVLGLCLASA